MSTGDARLYPSRFCVDEALEITAAYHRRFYDVAFTRPELRDRLYLPAKENKHA